MRPSECPELETLFTELADGAGPALDHAKGCSLCQAVMEEHRQLEKDLFRLMDPLPPSDFLGRVMAKVATEPPPARNEFKVAVPIFAFVLALCAGLLWLSGGIGSVAVLTASALAAAQGLGSAANTAAQVLWAVAPAATTATLLTLTVGSLLVLRRLTSGVSKLSEVRISS